MLLKVTKEAQAANKRNSKIPVDYLEELALKLSHKLRHKAEVFLVAEVLNNKHLYSVANNKHKAQVQPVEAYLGTKHRSSNNNQQMLSLYLVNRQMLLNNKHQLHLLEVGYLGEQQHLQHLPEADCLVVQQHLRNSPKTHCLEHRLSNRNLLVEDYLVIPLLHNSNKLKLADFSEVELHKLVAFLEAEQHRQIKVVGSSVPRSHNQTKGVVYSVEPNSLVWLCQQEA